MKRVFAIIGFSSMLTMLALNLINSNFIFLITIGLTVIFAVSLLLPAIRKNRVFELCLGSVIFSCVVFLVFNSFVVQPQLALDDSEAYCRFYITEQNSKTDTSNSYVAKIIDSESDSVPSNSKIMLYTDTSVSPEPYTVVTAKLRFFSQYENAFSSFGKYADGIFIGAAMDDVQMSDNRVFSPFSYVNKLRNSISSKLTYIIGGQEGLLSNALVTGDTSMISNYTKRIFKASGVSHIMAVSGLHLSLITGVFSLLLKSIKLKKKIRSVLSILLVLLYMALAGFSGSVVRAGIMMIILFAGNLFSRRADNLNSLGISAFLICLNPYAVTDAGALFSISAVLALVTLFPQLMKRMNVNYADPLNKTGREKIMDRYISVLSMFYASLSISIFCIPVMYMFYSSLSLVSPVSNLFVMPLGSACVVLSFLTYFASVIGINFVTTAFAFVTKIANGLLLKEVEALASLGKTSIDFDYRFGYVIAGVLVLIAISFIMNSDFALKISALLSVLVILFSSLIFSYMDKNTAKIYVFGENAVFTSYKGKNVAWGIDSSEEYYRVKNAVNMNGGYIDYLVCDNSTEYPARLSFDIPVNTLIYDEFNDTILLSSIHKDVEICNDFNVMIFDDFSFEYNNGDFSLNVKNFTLSSKDNSANVYLMNDTLKEKGETVPLGKNGVCFTVNEDNTYTVRRINQWQK